MQTGWIGTKILEESVNRPNHTVRPQDPYGYSTKRRLTRG